MKNVKRAIFPGTFDPFTIGHDSIVCRTLQFMDELIIGIGINENKSTYFPIDKRLMSIRQYYKDQPQVQVMSYNSLTADFAQQINVQFIVRGIRTMRDFEYEETIADINRKLSDIETILLFAEPEFAYVSSTMVRELLSYGKDVSRFLPEGIEI
ncbi:Phosphopantetheine adenylyltransferase [termite gut metagenome]|uniref:Phosphopantetheine adenylyltransferase n=1 Tax=termite gut metagenome TaxID=433724 RepID=A0A5J4SSQ2_9ZZZZ